MKQLFVLLLSLMSVPVMGNGGSVSTGAAEVDQKNLESLPDRTQQTRQKAQANPRNPAFSESFERVDGKPEVRQEMEDLDQLDEFKNDPYINTEDSRDPRE